MTKVNDGGPAFPDTKGEWIGGVYKSSIGNGMSLRDWFAGQALSGLNASPDQQVIDATAEEKAEWAYVDAEAMLKERG